MLTGGGGGDNRQVAGPRCPGHPGSPALFARMKEESWLLSSPAAGRDQSWWMGCILMLWKAGSEVISHTCQRERGDDPV